MNEKNNKIQEKYPIKIIPKEEIKQPKETIYKQPRRKGLIDIDTYEKLKGLLDTGKIVIGEIPLEDKKIQEKESIRHLEALTENSLSILENTNKISHKTISTLLSKEEVVVRRGPRPPTILERTVRKINRFNDMVNSFEKKAFSCHLDGISKDIIEGERLTTDIESYINEPIISRTLVKYNKILERYKNSINFIERKCKCKPN